MENIDDIIQKIFRKKPKLNCISLEQDFFDLGVSSLTIIELQIEIEEALNMTVATNVLMRATTIQEWINIYVEEYKKLVVIDRSDS